MRWVFIVFIVTNSLAATPSYTNHQIQSDTNLKQINVLKQTKCRILKRSKASVTPADNCYYLHLEMQDQTKAWNVHFTGKSHSNYVYLVK